MTAAEFDEVVAQVRAAKAHEFATPSRWNDIPNVEDDVLRVGDYSMWAEER